MKKRTFILSDQTRNYYGFVVLTAGIDLGRFKENPVLFYNHIDGDDPNNVVGRWDNLRVENGQLLGDADLDEDQEKGKNLSAKIEKGFIKGASIRLNFKYEDVSLDVKGYEGVPVVTKCEIMEASIVAIPNNKSAVRLCIDGKEVEDKSMALSLSIPKTPENIMKEHALIFAALGLTLSATSTEAHAVEAINALKAERDALKLKQDTLNAQLNALNDAKVAGLIDQAVANKKLKVEQKDHFTKLAKQDFDSTKAIIDTLQTYTPLTEQLSGTGGGKEGEVKNPYEGWDYAKYQKEAPGALLKLRAEKPEEYKKLWQAAFPNGTFNA